MSRPVPHSRYLTKLAHRVRTVFREELSLPTLLYAHYGTALTVLADERGDCLYTAVAKPVQLLSRLALPAGMARAKDLRAFSMSGDLRLLAAYDRVSKQFAVWSVTDGKMLNVVAGCGEVAPAIAFLDRERVAVCDGGKVTVHAVGGGFLYFTELPKGVRSVRLHVPKAAAAGTVIAAGVFQQGRGGHQLRSLRMETGRVLLDREGPYRPRPEPAGVQSRVQLHELLTVPGSTKELLVALEEEERQYEAANHHHAVVKNHATRLLAVDPLSGEFLPGEAEIPGRQCLERRGSGLHLVDEIGRRREVTGPPMAVRSIDWRLAG